MTTVAPKPKPKTALGKRLLAIRELMKITQADAAEKMGVSRQTWSAWERGSKSPHRAHLKLLDFLENGQL